MPVKFKGKSEYVNNFKWNNSYRSSTFVPKFQQVKRDAGLRSDEIYSMQEPKICSKKHVWHREPQVQSCLMWWPNDENDIASEARSEESAPRQKVVKHTKAEKPLEDKREIPSQKKQKQIVENKAPVTPQKINKAIQYTPRKKNASTATISQYRKNKFAQTPPKPSYSPKKSSNNENRSVILSSTEKYETKKKMQDKMLRDSERSPKNIPLQRRAGVAKSRSALNRLSEYQRMYSPPRSAIKSSPLISALDIVHSSSAAVAPPLKTKPLYRTTSEYNANFCRKFKPSPVAEPIDPPSPSMKAKIKYIQNPQKPSLPNAPHVLKVQSEYSREFARKDEGDEVAKRTEDAEENKQRHEGTHIDPEHLMQVPSKTNKFWDMSSQGSDEAAVEEVDIEEIESNCLSTGKYKDNCSVQSLPDSDSTYKDQLSSSLQPKIAWSDKSSEVNGNDNAKSESESNGTSSILEGRVTTPRIQSMNGALRTHHDLTTPCKGGALLVSPPSIADSCGSYVSSSTPAMESKPVNEGESSKHKRVFQPPTAGRKTSDLIPLVSERKIPLTKRTQQTKFVEEPPLKPQNKTIPLPSSKATPSSPAIQKGTPRKHTMTKYSEKENRPSETPMKTKKVMKSKFATMRAPIRGSLNTVEFQHCGPGPKTAPPLNFSELQNDDDRFDNVSLTSSRVSTMTQDLLEKAKSRKQFWSAK